MQSYTGKVKWCVTSPPKKKINYTGKNIFASKCKFQNGTKNIIMKMKATVVFFLRLVYDTESK